MRFKERLMKKILIDGCEFVLKKGDITLEEVDAIVNAANSSLMGGGGVDGAIHRAGGGAILEECKKIINSIGSLDTGKAVITTGGNLKAKYVIHTVGPVWRGGSKNEEKLLSDAYYNSLKIGEQYGIQSVAFPSISTGVYGYPKEKASKTAHKTVVEYIRNENKNYKTICFIVFSDGDYQIYENLFS